MQELRVHISIIVPLPSDPFRAATVISGVNASVDDLRRCASGAVVTHEAEMVIPKRRKVVEQQGTLLAELTADAAATGDAVSGVTEYDLGVSSAAKAAETGYRAQPVVIPAPFDPAVDQPPTVVPAPVDLLDIPPMLRRA